MINVHALLVTGVIAGGYPGEILRLQVTSAKDGAGWLAFFRELIARGLTGVRLVVSHTHRGLVETIGDPARSPQVGVQKPTTRTTLWPR